MRIGVALLAALLLLVSPATGLASVAGEQRQCQALIAELQAGTKTCADLSAEDFDHIGEYVMFRALGSTSLHQAMNHRMTAMLGEQGESRVHQLLGQRYAGCNTGSSAVAGYGGMMGGGMMGGDARGGGLGMMMGSGDWSWMMGGAWQRMTRQDWHRLQRRLLGSSASASNGDGWSSLAIIAVTAGGVLAVVVILAVIRRPFRRPPATAYPS